MSDSIAAITTELVRFRRERNWEHHHTPLNLAMSVAIEMGELLECFQWASDDVGLTQEKIEAVAEECADVAIYLFQVAEQCGIDLGEAIDAKIKENALRYPAVAV